jgi:hypothetical protein
MLGGELNLLLRAIIARMKLNLVIWGGDQEAWAVWKFEKQI